MADTQTVTRFGTQAVPIERVDVSAYTVPTDSPESDGTYTWDKTTIVIVEVHGGGKTGLGYTYADVSTAKLISSMLSNVVKGRDVMSVPACWMAMVESIRNLGRPGIASMAIAAVDAALWDLKARLLDLPLVTLLGASREAAPIYGSGGFTSYSQEQLQNQLGGWVAMWTRRHRVNAHSRRTRREGALTSAIARAIHDFRNCTTARAVCAGFSSTGTWPDFSIVASCEFAMPSW
jgi:L-alanine-DL-glutamate epimerase-like enolase superfamily enzyme